MSRKNRFVCSVISLAALITWGSLATGDTTTDQEKQTIRKAPQPVIDAPIKPISVDSTETNKKDPKSSTKVEGLPSAAAGEIPEFINKSIEWLVEAQHQNGGWGAGSSAKQKLRDPHKVKTDPATTAFTAMALIRAGHTPVSGKYSKAVRSATEHLVGIVEEFTKDGPRITNLTGTQPQAKMGPFVDTSMTAYFLARVLPTLPEDNPLQARVDRALDKTLSKLYGSQQKDGSWGKKGGWAPVLQSSLS